MSSDMFVKVLKKFPPRKGPPGQPPKGKAPPFGQQPQQPQQPQQFPPPQGKAPPFGQPQQGKAPPFGQQEGQPQEGQPFGQPPAPNMDSDMVRARISALRHRIAAGLGSGERKRLLQALPQFIQGLQSSNADPDLVRNATQLMETLSQRTPGGGAEDKWPHIRANPITERIGSKQPGSEDGDEEDGEGEAEEDPRDRPTRPEGKRPTRSVGPGADRHGPPRQRR